VLFKQFPVRVRTVSLLFRLLLFGIFIISERCHNARPMSIVTDLIIRPGWLSHYTYRNRSIKFNLLHWNSLIHFNLLQFRLF